MILSDQDIQEFQAMFKEAFGIDLAPDEALEQAMRLLVAVELTSNPAGTYRLVEGPVLRGVQAPTLWQPYKAPEND